MFLSHSMEKQNIKPGDIRNYKIKSFFYSLPSITNTHTNAHYYQKQNLFIKCLWSDFIALPSIDWIQIKCWFASSY